MFNQFNTKINKYIRLVIIFLIIPLILASCKTPEGKFKLPGGDARKTH